MEKSLKLNVFVDGKNDIPFPNKDGQIEISEFKYEAKRMGGAPTITATVMYESCLDDVWTAQVYAEFGGEKYYLKQTPTSSYDNNDSRYRHEVELVSERIILDNVYFYDTVADGTQGDDKPVSNSTNVTFFGDIHEFASRLGHSLAQSGLDYTVVVDNDVVSEEKLISFSDAFFSNVLQEIYKTYEIPYYFAGKVIHIGYSSNNIEEPFEQGVDNELLSVKKENANFKIVNRATATGSSDNIPFYYPNNSPKGDITAVASSNSFEVAIVDGEAFANKVAIDGIIQYKSFSLSTPTMTLAGEAYTSGSERESGKIYGSTTKEFELSFYAYDAGVFDLTLNYAISNVWHPVAGAKLTDDIISCRFSIYHGDEATPIVKSAESGTIQIAVEKSGNHVLRIVMEFASQMPYAALTCNYALSYYIYTGSAGWIYDGKEVDLGKLGLKISGVPSGGDTITQTLIKYVKTSSTLMPSIYRSTDGADRFYNAVNGVYEDENGDEIEFANTYTGKNPKEHIFKADNIKPTIKDVKVNGIRIDQFAGIAFDLDDNNETYEDGEGNTNYEHPYFFVKLHKLDFNLFDHAIEGQPMRIAMTSGACGACEFEVSVDEETSKNTVQVDSNGNLKRDNTGRVICGVEDFQDGVTEYQERQQDTINNEVWIALRKEESTFGILMPYAPDDINSAGHRPTTGDTFVILGINLPLAYIKRAEKKLEDEIIKYIKDNNIEKFKFSIGFSRIYFEENPDVLALLSENTSLKITYNERVYALYVSSFTYTMNEGAALPSITVELDDTLSVSTNALQNAVNEVKTALGGAVATYLDKREQAYRKSFITKQTDDTAIGVINFTKGVKFGEGGKVEILDNNSAKLTIEYLEVTKKASFTSLEIQEKTHVGGQMLVTPASLRCGEVEELDNAYRCYFQTRGTNGEEIFNQFVVGDQAICQTFNTWGSSYYWRLVTGVGDDYIDLSKTDCDEGSGIPREGHSIIQFGNRNDPDRQNAVVIAAVGENSPYIIQYKGINNFTLPTTNDDPRIVTLLSPQLNILTGRVVMHSGSKGLENFIEWAGKQEQIDNTWSKLQDLQDQVDGVIETWFYNGVPTLSNYPASEWNTEALKIQHLGDLYYDNDTGTAYRFSQDENSNYFWNIITDDAITKALAAAQKAQDTADGKRRVFSAQPTPPYDKGDLWVNATYGTQYNNDILRCVTAKAEGGSFAISDWTLASKYTDDTALNNFISDYESTIGDIKDQLDGKAQTWYQATDPSSAWNTAELKALHVGDLWYNTTNGTTWYWDGTQWKQQDVPDSVFDKIDGKADIFVAKPISGYHKNDLWFLESDYTLSGVDYKTGTLVVAIRDMGAAWSANDWIKKDCYTDDSALNEFKASYQETIGVIQGQIDGKAETWYQSTDPSVSWNTTELKTLHSGDLWYCTVDIAGTKYKKGTTWYWNGTEWQQQDIPQSVFDTIDGKADIFVSKPTAGYHKNDLWFLEAEYTLSDGKHPEGTLVVAINDMGASWSASDWAKKDRYTDDSLAQDALDQIASYEYLKEALKGSTVIDGGLVLSSLIKLGTWSGSGDSATMTKVYAGMNGAIGSSWSDAKKNKAIASWWGGGMVDKFYGTDGVELTTPLTADYAAALVRMDGSAYFSKGNIGFEADGSGWLGNYETGIRFDATGAMTFGNGIKINLSTGAAGFIQTIESLINRTFSLETLFVPCDANNNELNWSQATQSDGAGGIKAKSLKAKVGLWSSEWVSAFGVNPDAGGNIAVGVTELSELTDVLLSSPASGQALVYNGTKWVNQTISQGLDTTQLAQYLTTNNYAKKSDIPSLSDYATKQWVEGKGYLTSSALDTYATKEWVTGKGYITTSILAQTLNSYASKQWVNEQLSAIGSGATELGDLSDVLFTLLESNQVLVYNGYKWVNQSGYATQSWVNTNYVTNGGLDDALGELGYATYDGIEARGYLKSIPDTYATKSWVEGKGYLTGITKSQVEAVLTDIISSHIHSSLNVLNSNKANNLNWNAIKVNDNNQTYRLNVYDVYNDGGPTEYGNLIEIVGRGQHWQPQLWFDSYKSGNIRHRNKNYNDNTWGAWYVLLDTRNYASYLNSTYLPLSGGTMTGMLTLKGSQYDDSYTSGALNMNNSNILNVNSIYTADLADTSTEGIHFYRDATHVDTLWISNGVMRFVPNRALGATTAGDVVLTEGNYASVLGQSIYKIRHIRSDQNSIYDLRFSYGVYNRGDYGGAYTNEYPSNYGMYLALVYGANNHAALMFFDAPVNNTLGRVYVRTRGAGSHNTTYSSSWGALAYLSDVYTKAESDGKYLTSHQSLDYINVKDIRATTPKPNSISGKKVTAWFNNTDKPGTASWYSGLTVQGWTNTYVAWQIAADSDEAVVDTNLYFRNGKGETWNAWQTILTSANYTTLLDNRYASQEWVEYQSYVTPLILESTLNSYVKTTGDQTIGGIKTFSNFVVSSVNNSSSWWLSTAVRGKFSSSHGGSATGWSPAFGFKTTLGKYEIGSLDNMAYINYYNDTRTTNGVDYQLTIPKKTGTLAVTSDITSALESYLPLSGGTLSGLLTANVSASHTGIKLGNTYLTAINSDVIFQNNVSIRFGADAWDYNKWAGLKYDSTNKYVFLGIADGTAFAANAAQSDGSIITPGISNIYVGNNTTNKVWHAGNDGSGSGLDADMLDGIHSTSLFRQLGTNLNLNSFGDGQNNIGSIYINTTTPDNGIPFNYGSLLSINTGASSWLLGASNASDELYFRGRWWSWNNGQWSAWKRIAFTSSNVASASKLATTRTLWGQNFNGEANVSGNMTNVGDITTTGANGRFIKCNGASHEWGLHMGNGGENRGIYEWTSGYDKWLIYFTNTHTIFNHGTVGIGTTSPAYKLDVNGVINGGGLKVTGRVGSGGDDEGIVVGVATNGLAGVCLGNPQGVRSVFYLINGSPTWRYNNGSNSYDIDHPGTSGTIATQEWVNAQYYLDRAFLDDYISDLGLATKSWVGLQGYLKSVSWGTVTGKPTTIAGYGITDAKIANGVITLGGNTITPITSLAGYATTSWVNTNYVTNAGLEDALSELGYVTQEWVNGQGFLKAGSAGSGDSLWTLQEGYATMELRPANRAYRLTVESICGIYEDDGYESLILGDPNNESYVLCRDLQSYAGASYWRILENGTFGFKKFVPITGNYLYFTGLSSIANCQLVLGATNANASYGPATYKLYIAGSAFATGTFQSTSDMTLKNVTRYIDLSLNDIACAPAFEFAWKNASDNMTWIGSSAQYWKSILPAAVKGEVGSYSMNYGELALVSAISLARHVKTNTNEIDELKNTIKDLKTRIAYLENQLNVTSNNS